MGIGVASKSMVGLPLDKLFGLPRQAQQEALYALLYVPERDLAATPDAFGLTYEDVQIDASDGARLHAWWIPTQAPPRRGHVLFAHGNAGNISHRLPHAALLTSAGFDVMLFDYRGYGHSSGRTTERGTYRDARAARTALLRRAGIDWKDVYYLGESLGGAVVIELAVEHPPAGVVLTSTFTSVRDIARRMFPLLPIAAVPDAYPSVQRIGKVAAPVLIVHGSDDDMIPLTHARRLHAAAGLPRTLHAIPGAGHNDLVDVAGREWVDTVSDWVDGLRASR